MENFSRTSYPASRYGAIEIQKREPVELSERPTHDLPAMRSDRRSFGPRGAKSQSVFAAQTWLKENDAMIVI
jgi:hypothetical protein